MDTALNDQLRFRTTDGVQHQVVPTATVYPSGGVHVSAACLGCGWTCPNSEPLTNGMYGDDAQMVPPTSRMPHDLSGRDMAVRVGGAQHWFNIKAYDPHTLVDLEG